MKHVYNITILLVFILLFNIFIIPLNKIRDIFILTLLVQFYADIKNYIDEVLAKK